MFNGQDTLDDCYRSVISQTYKDFEWLVVDDQSTDHSFEMISNLPDSRIRLLQTSANTGGPAAPRNLAVDNSKGEFIAILDQDDIWDPDKLERQLDFMEKNRDIGFLSCNMRVIDDCAQRVTRAAIRKPGLRYPDADDIYRENPFLSSAIILRRFIIEDIGGFDECPEVCGRDEWELAIRVSLKYRTAFNGDHIAGSYRSHQNNLSLAILPSFGIGYLRNKHDHRFPDSLVRDVRGRDCYNIARGAFSSGEMDVFEEQISRAASYRSFYKWKGIFLKYKKYCKALAFMEPTSVKLPRHRIFF